jgi:hypothetical protein
MILHGKIVRSCGGFGPGIFGFKMILIVNWKHDETKEKRLIKISRCPSLLRIPKKIVRVNA